MRPGARQGKGPAGFTLIELLATVAIIAVVAAISIPTLLNAIDRSKQKKSMADLRTVGRAVASYAVDANFYPNAANMTQLAAVLKPDYTRHLPPADAWGNPLIYEATPLTFTIGSPGKEGGGSLTVDGGGGPTHSLDDDIIFSNGLFVQWPEGLQE